MKPLLGLQRDFYGLDEFAQRHGICLSTVRAEIKAGRLTAQSPSHWET